MDKKKKFIIFGVVLLLIVVSGITYAILTWNSTMVKIGINTNCFTIDYTKGGDITGNLKLMNENDLISRGKFTIKEGIGISGVNIGIKSSCSIEGLGNIYLNVSNISNALTTGDSKGALKYVVLKNNSSISNPSDISVNSLLNQSFDIVAIGSVDSSDKKLLYYTELSNTEIYKYIIAIYIDKALAGNDITEATFSGNISSDAEQLVATPDYCFDVDGKDDTDMTASINGYRCNEYNGIGYDAITEVIIPSEIDGYKITSLKYSTMQCYKNNICGLARNNLKKVIIPDSIITIESSVFQGNQLTSINIPDSVTEIGDGAFKYNNLNYVYIGSNSKLTSIGSEAFSSSNNTFGDFVDNPNLKVIYNNSGKAFDWNKIVNNESGTSFVTGTTNTRTSGSITYNPVEIKTGTP